jgi:filamentous hemagglutinin family protein
MLAPILCLALALSAATRQVMGGPKQSRGIRGDVTIERNGSRTIIRAGDGSIIHHASFDIAADELVRFIQPGKFARVLNRIEGTMPTHIEGTLRANGQVYLINPAGIIFGQGSVIDVGRIYAAAGHLDDADFIAGIDRFHGLTGDVINQGALEGRQVHLLGRHVANHGTIVAPRGAVTMLAGDEIVIREHGHRISVIVDGKNLTKKTAAGAGPLVVAAEVGVENTGSVSSEKGQIVLGAGDLQSLAIVNAGQLVSRSGQITVVGTGVELAAGSVTSVAGGAGTDDGGSMVINAPTGMTTFAAGAVIDASGGANGGQGGFVGVSGRGIQLAGSIDLAGGTGAAHGHLLLDPASIFISDTGSDDDLLNEWGIDFDDPDFLTNVFISDEALEAIVGDITLQATRDIYISAALDFTYDNNLTLEAFNSIFINAPINGVSDLTVRADFDGNGVGQLHLNAMLNDIRGSALFDGAQILHSSGLIDTGGEQIYQGPVLVLSDITLRGQRIVFTDTLDGDLRSTPAVRIVGAAEFQGPIGRPTLLDRYARGPLRSLTVQGPTTFSGGFVQTAEHQTYLGEVLVNSDLQLLSRAGDLHLGGTVDGIGGLVVRTDGAVRISGDIGSSIALDALSVHAGKGISLEMSRIEIVNDVLLNPNGRTSIPELATIAAYSAALTIISRQGNFAVGPNEKISALGDLTIEARNGGITVGDLNTLGDLQLDAPRIVLRLRPGGPVLNSSGQRFTDTGLDIISGGRIIFSSTPVFLGAGELPRLATPDGLGISDGLAQLRRVAIGSLNRSDFFFGDTVLDLAAPIPFTIANLIPREPPAVDRAVQIEPFALRSMEKLAINVRALDVTELVTGLDGREIYDDVTGQPDPMTGQRPITVSRLRRESVLLALQDYEALFGPDDQQQQAHAKRVLEQAWDDYEQGASDAIDPTTFRDFLAGRDDQADALAYMNGLTSLFDQIRIMGLTPREIRASAKQVLEPITPPNMRRDQLERAVGLDTL